jgi:SAM-dependent methyltransferase
VSGPVIFTPEYYARMRELESLGWWNSAMRDVAEMLLGTVALPGRGTVLDVGCGSGQTLTWFTEAHRGWTGIGCDIAIDGLRAAQTLGVPVSCASALQLPHPTASADLVITLDVVQHLPLGSGDLTALREMHRVLRPGGHFFLRTNAQAFPRAADDAAFNFHKYEPRELRTKLQDAGFTVLRLGRLNALLGLAEIPRELRALRTQNSEYHGILATPRANGGLANAIKRRWLRFEGQLVRAGVSLPLGRTIVALCRA